MKIERRPKKYSLQIATERHQRRRIPDGMTANCFTHVRKPLERHGRRALYVWYKVRPAWLSLHNADGGECRRQMVTNRWTRVILHVTVFVCGARAMFGDTGIYCTGPLSNSNNLRHQRRYALY